MRGVLAGLIAAAATGGPAAVTSLSFVASATALDESGSGGTITIPASAQENDVAVLLTFKRGASGGSANIPSGWTRYHNAGLFSNSRVQDYYKILSASDPGSSFDPWGSPADVTNHAILFVFRPDTVPSLLTPFGGGAEMTNSDPASQAVNASAEPAPLIIVAGYGGQIGVNTRSFSPAADAEVNANGSIFDYYGKRKIYNASPADTTIDMDDEGNFNGLHSLGLKVE